MLGDIIGGQRTTFLSYIIDITWDTNGNIGESSLSGQGSLSGQP